MPKWTAIQAGLWFIDSNRVPLSSEKLKEQEANVGN